MSFASEAIIELCREPLAKRCCALSECYGILLYCNQFSASEIRIVTSNIEFADRIPKLFRKAFGAGFEFPIATFQGSKFVLSLPDTAAIEKVFSAYR